MFTIALIGLTMLLFAKTRVSNPVRRRAVTPVAAVFMGTVAYFVISLYLLPAYPGTASTLVIVGGVLGLAIPIAILLGQVWGDLFAAINLGQIAVRVRDRPMTPSAYRRCLSMRSGIRLPSLRFGMACRAMSMLTAEPVGSQSSRRCAG